MNKIKLIVVAGATASGKTALSIELAKKFDAEIVSCDSMQIYRDMNIGTAKPDEEEKQGIPHHMMDFLSPEESFLLPILPLLPTKRFLISTKGAKE